jgi:hypothetical protein
MILGDSLQVMASLTEREGLPRDHLLVTGVSPASEFLRDLA